MSVLQAGGTLVDELRSQETEALEVTYERSWATSFTLSDVRGWALEE